jgi:pyridoxamine 5'-phosphate oxidase
MNEEILKLREEIARRSLDEHAVSPDPFLQFNQWFSDAAQVQLREPTAMALATASREGKPSVRMVLMKSIDERGVVFYTNFESKKAKELDENPAASLLFFWGELGRQVRIDGTVSRTSREEAEQYFKTRPHESRLAAWASKQSEAITSRGELEKKFLEYKERFHGGDVPLPPFWGGYRLLPESFEFWQGRENRLHDRIRYRRREHGWVIERLSP